MAAFSHTLLGVYFQHIRMAWNLVPSLGGTIFYSAACRLTFAVAFRDACFMVSIGHTILFAQRGTLVAFIHKNKCYIESLLYRTLSMIAGFRVGFSVRTSTYGSMMRN